MTYRELWEYLSSRKQHAGQELRYSRIDVFLGAVLAGLLMLLAADAADGLLTPKRGAIMLGIGAAVLLASGNRRFLLAGAVALVGLRLFLTAFLNPNPLRSVAGGAACGLVAWLIWRGVSSTRRS